MNYKEQMQQFFETDPAFTGTIGLFEKLGEFKRPRVLTFSHHDLDGVMSAFTAKRLLERPMWTS